MGSGSSKEKSQKTPQKGSSNSKGKTDSVGKNSRTLVIENKEPVKNDKLSKESNKQDSFNNNKTQQNTGNNGFNTNNTRDTKTNLGHFESDSDSEAEDISAVLAATKRENDSRVQQQNYYNSHNAHNEGKALPETYAQRLQREQYQHQQGLVRQKTIYRNPDDWEVDEILETPKGGEDEFDVGKFKQANVNVRTSVNADQTSDIYSSNERGNNRPIMSAGPNPDSYYQKSQPRVEPLPRYDTSEEALLDEIEQDYNF